MERRAAVLVLAAVIVASVAAFFGIAIIEAEGSPVGAPVVPSHFSPNGDGRHDTAIIKFTPNVTTGYDVYILDRTGRRIATVERDGKARADTVERIVWDGHLEAGGDVTSGRYTVAIRLDALDRTIRIPSKLAVDVTPPRLHVIGIETSPDERCTPYLQVDVLTEQLVTVAAHDADGNLLLAKRISRCVEQEGGHAATAGRIAIGIRVPKQLQAAWPTGVETMSVTVIDRAGNASTAPVKLGARGREGFQLLLGGRW